MVGSGSIPLAPLLRSPLLYPVAVVVIAVAAAAVPVARRRSLPVSAVNGIGVGITLVTAAILALIDAFARS